MNSFVGKRRGVTTLGIRTLSLATALTLVIGLFNDVQVQASASETFTYVVDADSNVTVTGCVGSCPADLIIPETLDENPVTSIASAAFYGASLTSVSIPNSVTAIGWGAFSMNLLTSVTIPNSVTSIGYGAFSRNLLASVTIPNSVTSIGYGAFYENSLTSVSFAGNAPSVGDGVFDSNAGLTSVDVQYGTTGWSATFQGLNVNVMGAPVDEVDPPIGQTITFGAITNQNLANDSLNLGATASSLLAVSYTSDNEEVCTVDATVVTFLAAGTCSVTAAQAGDATYAAAAPVTQTFEILKSSQSITFSSIDDQAFTTTPFEIAAESSSGLDVTFASNSSAVCTYDSELGALIFKSAGACSVTASQAGNGSYAAAPNVTVEFAISATAPGSPVIVFKRVRARADIWFVPGSTGGSTSVSYQYTLNGGLTWLTMTSAMIKQSLKWPPRDPDATQYEYDFVPPSLTLGTSYTIAIRAVNENGVSARSNLVTVKPIAPPRTPTITGSKYKYRTLWLSVAPPTNTGGSNILSYGFSVNNGKWKYIAVNKIRTYAPVGFIRKGRTCSVRVRARNAAGPGKISAPQIFTIS